VADLSGVKLRLVEGVQDAMDLMTWLGERREGNIAIDTESGGLNPHLDRLRMVQFGDMQYGWAVPWERWGGVVLEVFQKLRQNRERVTMHHGCFDWRFLQVHAGITPPWSMYDDTMAMAALHDPLRPKGLKHLASRLVDKTAVAGQKALDEGMAKNKWTWDTVPIDYPPYWVYSALDPVLTAHVDHILGDQVRAEAGRAYDLELATNRVCADMMLAGLRIDKAYIHEAIQKFEAFSKETRIWLKATHAITSPMSSGQLKRAWEAMGEDILFFTDAGAARFDKEALTFYQNSSPNPRVQQLARYLLAVRHADKMKGSYLENFLELADADDLIHASINTLAARTGRMSVTDPALQTLPRDDKVIRGSFVPRPGFVFISCDLDQVEARMGAHFSEDEGMIAAFMEADSPGGRDFFCGIASIIYDEDIRDKKDPRRQPVKNTVYGSLYGGGAATMAKAAGVPYEVMAPVKKRFDEMFPGLRTMSDRLTNEAKAQGDVPFIRTPLGRKLVADKGREYTQITNALIQGHAAEYFKGTLINLSAAGLGEYMRLPIHDECLLEVPIAEAKDILHVVEECMSDKTNYRVPITAGGNIMEDRWRKM